MAMACRHYAVPVSLLTLALAACGGSSSDDPGPTYPLNVLPSFIIGDVSVAYYDGSSDDLLTAGLGASGIATATAPAYADPLNPTATELRRTAIHTNYRALQDVSSGGGFGRLYGPHIGRNGELRPNDGRVAGSEYLAYADDGSGQFNVALMVQIPDSFDPNRPCIVTAPSSGSRGIYGAIGTAGEWGLQMGCAVAYTDKGSGTGFHDLDADTVYDLRGRRVANGSTLTGFSAADDPAALDAFKAQYPNHWAVKHAHSQQNMEAHWGTFVLWSVEFALFAINEQLGPVMDEGMGVIFTPENTLVIGSSVSNGGGASLRALEQDSGGLIDGVAVSEPNVQPQPGVPFVIRQGDEAGIDENIHSRSLIDYYTVLAVYQPCASLAPSNAGAPLNTIPPALGAERCGALREAGLLETNTVDEQAEESQAFINGYGFVPEQNILQPSHVALQVPQSIAVLYANQYGKYRVSERLCGFGYGGVDATGAVIPVPGAAAAGLFAVSNGIPPTSAIGIINDEAAGGPTGYLQSVSTETGRADMSFHRFLCLRQEMPQPRIQAGVAEVRADAALRGKPVVFVTGRDDAILPINHHSRPYYALSQLAGQTNTRYYEVPHAQHLDALNGLPGFAERYVPLHYYFLEALDLVYANLTEGAPLPPSQVVPTTPRGEGAPALTTANVPAIAGNPAPGQLITFDGQTLAIPD